MAFEKSKIKDQFNFKEFSIRQSDCIMKVGTDGTLLGAWADVAKATTALDIGTGSGLISLMLAQRNKQLAVDAIELDTKAAKQAILNAANSKFSNRIEVYQEDFNQWETKKKYDLIVSNPPFFESNPGLANSQNRAPARQQINLQIPKLIEKAVRMLTERGKLALIVPMNHESKIRMQCDDLFVKINRVTIVKGHPTAAPKRVLLEIMTTASAESIQVREELILREQNQHYSHAYQLLCKDFYINW